MEYSYYQFETMIEQLQLVSLTGFYITFFSHITKLKQHNNHDESSNKNFILISACWLFEQSACMLLLVSLQMMFPKKCFLASSTVETSHFTVATVHVGSKVSFIKESLLAERTVELESPGVKSFVFQKP